ncbi:MAG TPA: glycine zipper 2TM domain-containing protein [Gallionella sp.]|nr:glycine zipper 2TM domain-containing protein [Gallionella sp.]
MKKPFAIALFLSASVNAYAVDSGAVVGSAVGGAAGAAIGHNMGGRDGAILGAAIGGATGAAVGSRDSAPAVQPAPAQAASYREAENDDGHRRHDNGLHLGQQKKKHKKKHEQREDD